MTEQRQRIDGSADGKWAVWEVQRSIASEGIPLPTVYEVRTDDEVELQAPEPYRFKTEEKAKRRIQELNRD